MSTEHPTGSPAANVQKGHSITVEPYEGRIEVKFGGVCVADSTHALLLCEQNLPPVQYFPREDVRMELLLRTSHTTRCPFKGNASYWSIEVDGKTSENAVWSYENPIPEMVAIGGYLAFYRDRMDDWRETFPNRG